jgi:hypothetical protein
MNKINKNNIEAWLLDYSEGQLNEKELVLLETFLEENPEYRQLLNDFEPLYLPAEEHIVFAKKEALLKPSPGTRILHFSVVFPRLLAAAAVLAAIVLLWPQFRNNKASSEIGASLTSPEIHLPATPHIANEHTTIHSEEKNKKEENTVTREPGRLASREQIQQRKESEKENEREATFSAERLQKEMSTSIAQNPGYNRYSEIPGWYGSKPVAMKNVLPLQNKETASPNLMQSLLRSEMARALIPESLEENLPQSEIDKKESGPVIYLKVPPAGKKIIDKFLNR